jgi:hypothetical protein
VTLLLFLSRENAYYNLNLKLNAGVKDKLLIIVD